MRYSQSNTFTCLCFIFSLKYFVPASFCKINSFLSGEDGEISWNYVHDNVFFPGGFVDTRIIRQVQYKTAQVFTYLFLDYINFVLVLQQMKIFSQEINLVISLDGLLIIFVLIVVPIYVETIGAFGMELRVVLEYGNMIRSLKLKQVGI